MSNAPRSNVSEPLVIKSRQKVTTAPRLPHVRFITCGLWKTDGDPADIVRYFLTRGYQAGDIQQRGELARLYKSHSRITIRHNGYIFPGGAGGDALNVLDKLSRGQQ